MPMVSNNSTARLVIRIDLLPSFGFGVFVKNSAPNPNHFPYKLQVKNIMKKIAFCPSFQILLGILICLSGVLGCHRANRQPDVSESSRTNIGAQLFGGPTEIDATTNTPPQTIFRVR